MRPIIKYGKLIIIFNLGTKEVVTTVKVKAVAVRAVMMKVLLRKICPAQVNGKNYLTTPM